VFEKKTSKGVLKYRMPTIIESVSLIRLVRGCFELNDTVGAKLILMENIKELFDYSAMDGVKSFEDLNSDSEEFTSILFEVSDDILNKIVGAFSKKS
jgi:hypothetical protein